MPKRKNPENDDIRPPLPKRTLLQNTQESSENDSHGSIAEDSDRVPTPMLLGQRSQSMDSSIPDRQASREGDTPFSLGSRQSSIDLLDYLPDYVFPPVIPVVGQGVFSYGGNVINHQRGDSHLFLQARESDRNSTQSVNEYDVDSQYLEYNNPVVDSFPNRQPSPDYFLNFTQSPIMNRANSDGTVVETYMSPPPNASSNNGTQVYFFITEDYNLPEDIYDKLFEKDDHKSLEINILNLDFSNIFSIGLIAITLYSY